MGRLETASGRLIAVVVAIAATVAIWIIVFGGGDGGANGQRSGPDMEISAAAAELVAGLSDSQKVEQLILAGFDPGAAELPISAPGAVFIATTNWPGAAEGAQLIAEIRSQVLGSGGIAPLIVTRQEGGEYRELLDLPPEPRPIEVGDNGDPAAAEALALQTGEALRSVGIDLNLAPVADVASLDSPIADRAFSDDVETVAQMVAASTRGCRKAEIACAAAHFPGLGAASQDTNEGPATVGVDRAGLAGRDLLPFQAAFEERIAAVVLSHAFYSAFDPITPASLAPEIATGLLREELGFEGLAITDDLGAGAIRSGYTTEEAAVLAIAAGADMVQIRDPSAVIRVRKALIAALAGGQISRERLDEAAARVLELKDELEASTGAD